MKSKYDLRLFFAVIYLPISMNWLAHSVGRSFTRATSWFFSQYKDRFVGRALVEVTN